MMYVVANDSVVKYPVMYRLATNGMSMPNSGSSNQYDRMDVVMPHAILVAVSSRLPVLD